MSVSRRASDPPESERQPLMAFNDVTMRVFPLRANLQRLRLFCAQYLNIAPEIVRFEPVVPFVFFMMVNYGRMTSIRTNEGYIAQNEFLFNVPLIEYRRENGRWIPRPAATAPFIFVDDQFSVIRGREVAGWPKVKAWLKPSVDPWTRDPRSRRPLTTVKTAMFSELFAGQRLRPEVLLEIDQEVPPSLLELPTGLEYFLRPLARLPLAAARSALDLVELADGVRDVLATGDWGRGLLSMWTQVLGGMRQAPPRILLHSVNLKQFRSSEDAALAAYQEILRFEMSIVRLNASGLLGGVEFLRGDPGAGFRLRIHQQKAFPIVDVLGLEVTAESRLDRLPVATVKPVLPFWFSADLQYEGARQICWRTQRSEWQTQTDAPAEEAPSRSNPLITTLGPLVNPPAGPFFFQDVTLRVIPLAIDRQALGLWKQAGEAGPTQLQVPGIGTFRPEGELAYLFVNTYGEMSSQANNAGWWADREVAFVLPLAFEGEGDSTKKIPNYVFWPAHYADSMIAVTTGREVTGLPTTYGFLNSGVDPWLDPDPDPGRRCVFDLEALVFPGLGMGQAGQRRVLLDVFEKTGLETSILEPGAAEHTLHNMSLKRFKDAEDPDRWCYESLIANGINVRVNEARREAGEDGGSAHEVCIRRYESNPLVSLLGLKGTQHIHRGVLSWKAEALPGIVLRMNMTYELGKRLAFRTFGGPWQGTEQGRQYLEEISVGDSLFGWISSRLDPNPPPGTP